MPRLYYYYDLYYATSSAANGRRRGTKQDDIVICDLQSDLKLSRNMTSIIRQFSLSANHVLYFIDAKLIIHSLHMPDTHLIICQLNYKYSMRNDTNINLSS